MSRVIVEQRNDQFTLRTETGFPVGERMWRGRIKDVPDPPEETSFSREMDARRAALAWNYYLIKSAEQRKKK